MERMTGIDEHGYYTPLDATLNCLKHRGEGVDRLGAYEDTGLMPEEIRAYWTFFEDLIGDQKANEALSYFRNLLQADRDGRVKILPEGKRGTCGSCKHFQPIPESHSGTCRVKPCRVDRQGRVYPGTPFYTYQSRKSCKQYSTLEEAEAALKEASHEAR